MTAPPSKKPRVVRGSERVRESARVAGWAVGLSGLVSLVGALLAQHRAGSLAVQTFAAEWGAGQLGVAWSDPEAPVPSNALLARRVARGAGLGLLAAGTSLVFASLTGAATFGRPRATPYELLAGLAIATFLAMHLPPHAPAPRAPARVRCRRRGRARRAAPRCITGIVRHHGRRRMLARHRGDERRLLRRVMAPRARRMDGVWSPRGLGAHDDVGDLWRAMGRALGDERLGGRGRGRARRRRERRDHGRARAHHRRGLVCHPIHLVSRGRKNALASADDREGPSRPGPSEERRAQRGGFSLSPLSRERAPR